MTTQTDFHAEEPDPVELVDDTAGLLGSTLELIQSLMVSQEHLIRIIDDVSRELASVSVRLAALGGDGTGNQQALRAQTRQAHDHADAFTARAAAILNRSRSLQDGDGAQRRR